MNRLTSPLAKRFIACLAGGLVLALMVGRQEGTTSDYGFAFRESVFKPRVVVFLLIGVVLFLAITFWPKLVPYLTRPGFWPLLSGALAVVVAQALMHWYDGVGDAKFGTVGDAVSKTSGISQVAKLFFSWLAWVQLVVLFAAGLTAIVLTIRKLAFLVAALSVPAAVVCFLAHRAVVNAGGTPDHSLGYAAAILGYAVIITAMLATALTEGEVARGREIASQVLGFRPGLPLVVLGTVLGVLAFFISSWFAPQFQNDSLSETHDVFVGSGVAGIALTYLSWLGYVLLAAAVIVAGAACWLRNRALGWAGTVIGLAGALLTLITLYQISKTAAETNNFDGATGPWQNLGAGGWMGCAALFLIGAGAFIAATTRTGKASSVAAPSAAASDTVQVASAKFMSAPGVAKSLILVAIAAALFYPPTATPFWQQVLVTETGTYMLLAVGLNVVVGWAGLLDLGFIAFYAIGSYTTAYLVGSLPVKPPSWLEMSPLLAIPFAIVVCLLAGLALGAPTLRLRGDYLAIVTLGFGEIIHLAAVNSTGITNGSQGPSKVIPNPSIHIGPLHIQWGLAQLQYWYLLIVLIGIIVLAFRRLENSRLGRAWAAVREDEVAAQATGINTTRVKLLAFAIGASTSGVAGVFFASQVGSFTPDSFVLNNSILIVAYVVFGGMGSLPGAMAGAALLTWLPEFLKDQVPSQDRLMWIGAVVLLMMIFRPAGMIPARRRKAELSHFGQSSSAESTAVPVGEGMG